MFDRELVLEIVKQIEHAVEKITTRFQAIAAVSDFTDTPEGVEKLDAICMMLIVIGEALKNLDKVTGGELLPRYPQVDWKKAKGMRDILTHHYADVNPEAVYYTCREKIPELGRAIRAMREDLQK